MSRYEDDLIHTLSDGDVSDEDFEQDEPEVAKPAVSEKKKRKREKESQSAVKKQKADKDEDLDSDFEFGVEDQAGMTEDLDTWALTGDTATAGKGADIDSIIARRRAKAAAASTPSKKAAVEDSDDSEHDELEDNFLSKRSNTNVAADDDELEVSDGDDEDAEEEEEDDGDEAEDTGASGNLSDDENEVVAKPVAHPDDAASDGSADEDEEDDAEEEKRNAFFAKEPEAKRAVSTAFHDMHISRPILRGLAAVGFDKPTPIQAKTIPVALEGKDLVGGAVTGSGKTGAFLIPILERLLFRPKRTAVTRVVILLPTRELALQCFAVATKLASFTDITFGQAIGGLNSREQEKQLKLRPDIVIATPGRFIDLERNSASFAVNTVEILVLDEADRMLEEGFADELNEILLKIPKSRQTMLFSATMTSKVDDLVRVGLQKPVRLLVDAQKQTVSGLVQEFVRLRPGREEKRLAYLMHLAEKFYTDRVIIFFRQKKEAHRVRVIFALCGMKAAELHGSMSQEQRINAIEAFRTGAASYLLATDLASRGLDIKGIETVINYEAPQTHEIYLHRVGRTARAGRTGRSCTLAAEPDRKVVKAAIKTGKAQGAQIRPRTVDGAEVDTWHARLQGLEQEVEDVLREEKEERALQQIDRDLNRADNMEKYKDEIEARPKKTWFEGQKDKQAAQDRSRALLNGVSAGENGRPKEKKGKLSNKQKKALLNKDERKETRAWKKTKVERLSDGKIVKPGKGKPKSGGKPGGKPGGRGKPRSKN